MTDTLKKVVEEAQQRRKSTHLLDIPNFLKREKEPTIIGAARISREIIIPKPMSDRRRRSLRNKLRHLGYPDSAIKGTSTEWKLMAIKSGYVYKDPLARVKEVDAVVEEAANLSKEIKK